MDRTVADDQSFDPDAFNAFEASGWRKAAQYYHGDLGMVTSQSASELLDAAEVGAGSAVLDIATGPGYLAARAHARGADPVGIDITPEQVELARRLNPKLSFALGDAEQLDFPDDRFDAVVLGFGMLHFGRPEVVIAEIARVLRRGGRVAFSVWKAPEDNPGMAIMYGSLAKHADMTVPLPEGPSFFRFADHDECRRLFAQVGLVDPQFVDVPQVWRSDSPEQFYETWSRAGVRSTALINAQTPDVQGTLREVITQAVVAYREKDAYEVPMPAVVASARKP
ncbi:MAG: class I SAM-dependent methyltransferase [Alphaproteobacteria bacterium]|nr:class I SAM-dependent methyltransferase [Alphaproteobacteria bacterium]